MPDVNAADYLWQFQRLLPRGKVWQRGWGTLQAAQLLTLMPTWVRLHLRAENLLVDAFPCSTLELLPEWEASLGLPDPCTGPLATLQERQAAVCAKFSARGGQSKEYFIRLAASLGYQIRIDTFKPFYASEGRAGDPLYSEAWAYTMRVTVYGAETITYFRAGLSTAGEPLESWGSGLLPCLFASSAPAWVTIIWSYEIGAAQWDDGESIWDTGDSIWDEGASNDIAN